MPHVPSGALDASEGGRRFFAVFFATELRRHDFAGSINTRLIANFACALVQHHPLRQPLDQTSELKSQCRLIDRGIFVLTERLEDGHPYKCVPSRLGRVLDYCKSVIQVSLESVAELIPIIDSHLIINQFDKAGQPRYLARKENRSRYIGSKNRIDIRELAQIYLSASQPTEIASQCKRCGLQLLVVFQSNASSSSLPAVVREGISLSEFLDPIHRVGEIRGVGGRKYGAHSSTGEESPDCWAQQGRKNAKHGADTGPCIPVYSASFAQPPALTNSIDPLHLPISLSGAEHSATLSHRRYVQRATLATVKPPRDLRTRLREDR